MSSDGVSNKQSLQYILRSGLAGGVAGCVAKTVVAPLDRVKILFQTSNSEFRQYAGTWTGAFRAAALIYHESGIRGLLQGHSATLLRIFPYAAIKFMAYDQIEHVLMPTRESETNVRRFLAGALSGMTSVICTYPLELIRVRMAFMTRSSTPHAVAPHLYIRPSFVSAMSEIYHENTAMKTTTFLSTPTSPSSLFTRFPILKFYRGFTVSIIGMIPYAGMSFLAWGFLRARFLPPPPPSSAHQRQKPTPVADLAIGAVSGALAQTVSYPFEVIRRRMQVGGLVHPDRWMRWGETFHAIWNANGWRGFYVGLSVGYLKIVPMTAVSFAVWQWGKRVLGV
ncbi:mitochondrial carrier [Laetiporus sulphureus 93-53]|uniref:Mitochondrial carrier n=1 Tax=Laetiporus sulphureus 93-53 TaxID=1314785 RepID=A0A165BF43_9APHY|nr:mitochondrial carrier [Laetiporus sulphureus 93-53]KZT00920.1 mitochondrial carrier [Laetiporus sulphureus 93-53]